VRATSTIVIIVIRRLMLASAPQQAAYAKIRDALQCCSCARLDSSRCQPRCVGAHPAADGALGQRARELRGAPVVKGDKAVVDALEALLAREVDVQHVAPLPEVRRNVLLLERWPMQQNEVEPTRW